MSFSAQNRQALWEWILIGLGVVMYLFVFPHGIHGDAAPRYQAMLQFLETGKLPPMPYSYVHPLFSALLLLPAKLVKDGYWWVSRFNAFLFLGTVWYAASVFRRKGKWDAGAVRRMILILLAATMFPKHVTDYYPEVFSACLAFLSILFFLESKSALAVLAICLSVWNVIGTAVAGAALLGYYALRSRQLRYLAAIPLLAAGFLGENFLKYGSFYPTAYLDMQMYGRAKSILPYATGPAFGYPIFFGLLSILFSYGRGLLFFTPGLLAMFHGPSWRKNDALSIMLGAGLFYLLGLILVYGRFWAWYGGWFWGPRYFLFCTILAAFALIAMHGSGPMGFRGRLFWFVALLLSLWVGCQGVLFGQDFLEDCNANGEEFEFLCHYIPEYSALWRFFVAWPPIRGRKAAYLVYFFLVAATLLWRPGRVLGADVVGFVRRLLRERLRFSAWRF